MTDQTICREIVRTIWEKVLDGDQYDLLDGHFADNYTFNGAHQTTAQVKAWMKSLKGDFESIHFDICDLFGEGAYVCIRWVLYVTTLSGEKEWASATNVLIFDGHNKCIQNWQNGIAAGGSTFQPVKPD